MWTSAIYICRSYIEKENTNTQTFYTFIFAIRFCILCRNCSTQSSLKFGLIFCFFTHSRLTRSNFCSNSSISVSILACKFTSLFLSLSLFNSLFKLLFTDVDVLTFLYGSSPFIGVLTEARWLLEVVLSPSSKLFD